MSTAKNKTPTEFECIIDLAGCTVLFRVLKQSSEITRINRAKMFRGSKLFIRSINCPALETNGIYIRGDLTYKNENFCVRRFTSIEEAREYYQLIITTLEEWKKSGFKMEDF